jgi:hypothetical protein
VSERLGLDSGKPILSWLTNLAPMLVHSLSRYVFITAIGEAALGLWLIVAGVDAERWNKLARATEE